MAQFVDLLGEWLVGKDGLAKTTDLVANKKAIGLYFSAGWCPPCKVFTPKLVEKYETKLEAKGMEIVLVPTDSNEYETEVHHKSTPWLALPYKDWKKGIRLSRKYVIPGVPCLVILDCNGKLVTNDGKSLVENADENVTAFPWYKSVLELAGGSFSRPDNSLVGNEAIEGKIVGFFFTAHYCSHGREFTKVLTKCYEATKKKNYNFEVVFVSDDADEQSYKENFKTMPWLALPYSKTEEHDALTSLYDVSKIPTLVIVDTTIGTVLNEDARREVELDPEGEKFPWAQKIKSPRWHFRCWPARCN